jgi:hypothetical protein
MGGMQMRIRPWLRTPITAAEECEEKGGVVV